MVRPPLLSFTTSLCAVTIATPLHHPPHSFGAHCFLTAAPRPSLPLFSGADCSRNPTSSLFRSYLPAVTSSTASTITLSNTCARNPCCAVIFCENTVTSCTGNYDTSFTNGTSSVQTTLAAWVVAVIVVGVVIVIAAAVREVCRRRAIKAAQNATTTIVVGNPVANPSAVMAPPEYAASSAMPPPLPPTAMYPPPAMPPAPPYPSPPYGGAPGIYVNPVQRRPEI